LSLSSNYPLYYAPANKLPRSNANILTFIKFDGTSPFKTLYANPSTIYVLPVPYKPVKTGQFLVLLDNTSITLLISLSLPIHGDNFPASAYPTSSIQYYYNALATSSAFSFYTGYN